MREVTINLRLGFLSANHTLDATGASQAHGAGVFCWPQTGIRNAYLLKTISEVLKFS